MKKILFFLVVVFLGTTLYAADRYIVVLDKKPVVKYVKRDLKSKAAKLYRDEILEQQKDFSNYVEKKLNGKTYGSVQSVLNAVFVEIDSSKLDKLKAYSGVKYVAKDRTYTLNLDAANRVCDNIAIYRQLGMSNLDIGKGVKIAILDTGIDISNPMFDDTGFEYPQGFDPGSDNQADLTNNKVIVAKNFGADPDASDIYGHGTACAGCAAGRYVEIQDGFFLYKLLGAAPGAYLGNYKVFKRILDTDPTSATFGSYIVKADTSAVINGVDAAVQDGMDILSLSLGGDIENTAAADDPEIQAIENAIDAGVVVTIAAGNDGDNFEDLVSKYNSDYVNHLDEFSLVPRSIGSPGNAPDAITVGAIDNDRDYSATREATFYVDGEPVDGLTDIVCGYDTQVSISLAEFSQTEVVDLADYTSDEEACSSLDGIDLSGKVVLVKRGDCYFCQKIKNCQDAGAAAVIVYNNIPSDQDGGGILNMDTSVSTNCPFQLTIPGFFVSYETGMAVKQLIADSDSPVYFAEVTQVNLTKIAYGYKTWFSSTGPTKLDYFLKPDVAAPGQRIMAPTTSIPPNVSNFSTMYSETGFGETQGTSFSTPYTAGIVAAYKSIYPNLSPMEIKGIICTATEFGYDLYQSEDGINNIFYTNGYAIPAFLGGGIVQMDKAVNAKLSLIPSNISFGSVDTSKSAKGSLTKTFTVKNVSDKTVSFIPSLLNICSNAKVNASISPTTKQTLDPGESATITVTAKYTDPAATHLMGYVIIDDSYGNEYKLPFYGVFKSEDVPLLSASADQDGDKISNGIELDAWTDVYVTDTDNDGMSDADEMNGIDINGKTVHFNPANATSVYYNPFDDTALNEELYVPVFMNDYDSDEFGRSYLYISNPNDSDVKVKILPMSTSGVITTTVRERTIPAKGWVGVKIDRGMMPVSEGWILVKSNGKVNAVLNTEDLVFNRKKPNEEANYYVEDSAAIAATDTLYSKVYVPHIAEQTNQWETFVSIANPGSGDLNPQFVVPGSNPVDLSTVGQLGSLPIDDIYSDIYNGSFPYPDTDKPYWWGEIDGNGGVFAAAEAFSQLKFDDDSDPTPLLQQIGALLLTDESSTTLVIPHVDIHWLWWTGIAINNVNSVDATITMTPYDNDGNKLTPVTFTLPANSKAVNLVQGFWTTNSMEYPEDTTWIKITSDQPITGFELFGIDPTKGTVNNGQDALSGIRPIMNGSTKLVFPYVFKQTSAEWCGISVINANDDAAHITVNAYNALGEKVGTVDQTIGANQKWIGVVDENLIPGLTDDVKWIEIVSDKPVGGFALFGDLARYYMSGYKAVNLD